LREIMQFLFVTLPSQADSNAVTETAPPLNQG